LETDLELPRAVVVLQVDACAVELQPRVEEDVEAVGGQPGRLEGAVADVGQDVELAFHAHTEPALENRSQRGLINLPAHVLAHPSPEQDAQAGGVVLLLGRERCREREE
jgi:hypothetical protein